MRAKHTPGQWIVTEGEFGDAEFIITTRQRKKASQVQICEMDIDFEGQIGIEQKANARLIAAAPAMLEALRVAKSAIEMDVEAAKLTRDKPDDPIINQAIEDYQADLDIINNAITLATGEQA